MYNNWTGHPPLEQTFTIHLDEGVKRHFLLEYYQGTGGSTIKLEWSGPVSRQVIPSSNMWTWDDSNASEVLTKYIYDGWNLIAETNSSNTVLRTYTWGMDASGTLQGAGGVGGLLMIEDGSNSYYPTYDGSHNIDSVFNQSGTLSAAYDYDAYGRSKGESGTYSDTNPFRHATKFTDKESGFVYYGLRYYNPRSGRFLNRDPIGEAGGVNLYGFVGNDPVNSWDYLGMAVASVEGTLSGGLPGFGGQIGGGIYLETANAKSVFDFRVGLTGFKNWGAKTTIASLGIGGDISISPAANYGGELQGKGIEITKGFGPLSGSVTYTKNEAPLVFTGSFEKTIGRKISYVSDVGPTNSYYSDSISLRELYNLALPKAVFSSHSSPYTSKTLSIVEKYLGTAKEYEDWMFDKNYSKKYNLDDKDGYIYESYQTLEPFVVYGDIDESESGLWVVNLYAESRHKPFKSSVERWTNFGFGKKTSSYLRSILDPVGHAESQLVQTGHMTNFEAQSRAFARQEIAKFYDQNEK